MNSLNNAEKKTFICEQTNRELHYYQNNTSCGIRTSCGIQQTLFI